MERPDSRLIRVFLSSTFVDFQEERSLLVQQVFPSLRRRARSREVEIVDVDLRWGVTAEQSEQGETLPLCLGEIDRCRPYFISLLGERYGWVPPPNYYKPELLERQPWLKERMGGASVTELEILHGVLRNPEMAGHAFFYLRDPAYAQAQSEPGWVAESPQEQQRLAALKAEIRTSGFPVAEGLPTPKAIAERIEADLWQLIESQFPEQEPADALEREARKHAEFRRARNGEGQYIGGEASIQQLEQWITEGQQQILITGESGSGKSALIANWMQHHLKENPDDVIHAHHLGCTNDASALRPMLGRLIDTASQLLLQEQQISEAIHVPQDWWELVFKVGEVFALLSPWCQRQGRRWILVLDGLDRMAEDDQKALPWIPTAIPPGIHVVASALDCPARTILQERQYRTHEIGPLGKSEQQQLIEHYLSRYTKQLESGLQQRILAHPLAGSPLFLRVLLEELRQCAWFDTLQGYVEFYLSAETIDGLYTRVLERLENDCHGEAVRHVMKALWASRAGLSEDELLAITGVAPLHWVPIDVALEQAFGRNQNRLVFDHDYLRIAVKKRYLSTRQSRIEAHSKLASWYQAKNSWNKRHSEELLWQLQQAGKLTELRQLLLVPGLLSKFISDRGSREIFWYWDVARPEDECEIDELITDSLEHAIEERRHRADELLKLIDPIIDFLEEAGLRRDLLIRLVETKLDLRDGHVNEGGKSFVLSLSFLAELLEENGRYNEAEACLKRLIDVYRQTFHPNHPATLLAIARLQIVQELNGDFWNAARHTDEHLSAIDQLSESEVLSHPETVSELAAACADNNHTLHAEKLYRLCVLAFKKNYGFEHPLTLATAEGLALILKRNGNMSEAEALYLRILEAQCFLWGSANEQSVMTSNNLAVLYKEMGCPGKARELCTRSFEASIIVHGREHPQTLLIQENLLDLIAAFGELQNAIAGQRSILEIRQRRQGLNHPDTISSRRALAFMLSLVGNYTEAEGLFAQVLKHRKEHFGRLSPITIGARGRLYLTRAKRIKSQVLGRLKRGAS